jgi:23S rRNA (adenine2503-C2)-methyltransferase
VSEKETIPLRRRTTALPALSALDHAQLDAWARERKLPAYRGRQIFEALHRRAVQSWDELTELPRSLRDDLQSAYALRTVTPRVHLKSRSDRAEKALFGLWDGTTVETVLIRASNPDGAARNTICVSSQVGCPAGCSFCATGLSGFTRNLTWAEIADQVEFFAHTLRSSGERVTNVVYMGMGEPLLNVPNVRQSIEVLTDSTGFNLGERHITVSTVGIVPQMRRLAEWMGQVNLAVSLHAPNDTLRSTLVPYNERFPIADLLDAVADYIAATRRRVSFEYVLLRGVNDDPALAVELGSLLRRFGGMAHVNLIPWNPFREGRFIRSEGPDADAFATALRERGVNVTVRYSRGLDISAACGQLREQIATAKEAVEISTASS